LTSCTELNPFAISACSPATLFTYAILDLSHPGQDNNLRHYISDLFTAMKTHGMKIPSEKFWQELTVSRQGFSTGGAQEVRTGGSTFDVMPIRAMLTLVFP
jgi:hypothetical protein